MTLHLPTSPSPSTLTADQVESPVTSTPSSENVRSRDPPTSQHRSPSRRRYIRNVAVNGRTKASPPVHTCSSPWCFPNLNQSRSSIENIENKLSCLDSIVASQRLIEERLSKIENSLAFLNRNTPNSIDNTIAFKQSISKSVETLKSIISKTKTSLPHTRTQTNKLRSRICYDLAYCGSCKKGKACPFSHVTSKLKSFKDKHPPKSFEIIKLSKSTDDTKISRHKSKVVVCSQQQQKKKKLCNLNGIFVHNSPLCPPPDKIKTPTSPNSYDRFAAQRKLLELISRRKLTELKR